MAIVEFDNQLKAQALRGQDVIVTLNASDSSKLSSISVGQEVAIEGTGGNSGIVSSIDSYGHSFKVRPFQPNFSFCENNGILELVVIQVTV